MRPNLTPWRVLSHLVFLKIFEKIRKIRKFFYFFPTWLQKCSRMQKWLKPSSGVEFDQLLYWFIIDQLLDYGGRKRVLTTGWNTFGPVL